MMGRSSSCLSLEGKGLMISLDDEKSYGHTASSHSMQLVLVKITKKQVRQRTSKFDVGSSHTTDGTYCRSARA